MARSSWLHRGTTVVQSFERRAGRADLLVRSSDNSAVLQFAAGLYRAQAQIAAALQAPTPLSGVLAQDLPAFATSLGAVAHHAGEHGPPGLRAAIDAYRSAGTAQLLTWWRESRSGRVDYLARLLLRPYAESLAARDIAAEPLVPASAAGAPAAARAHGCPGCGGLAWIGWRRSGAGDEAAPRFLGCGVCGREQQVNRIGCAACGEATPDRLPIYQSERHPAVRLEACDTCQRYVKSIDLTVDGLAIPEIDDLRSLAMDLWASEQGYERLEPSLAGI